MNRIWLILTSIVTMVSISLAEGRKLSPDLETQKNNSGFVDVIVQYRTKPGAAHRRHLARRGGQIMTDLPFIKALHVSMPASQVAKLAKDAEVAYVSANRPIRARLNNSAGAVLAQYAWSLGLDGKGVGVAVIDSGVHAVDDLKAARIRYKFDAIGGGTDDQYGHGTHVAGIIAGDAADSSCPNCDVAFRGIAPNATIVNFHALDKNGEGTDVSVIKAINQAISVKDIYNIRVMNLSLGRPVMESYTQDPLCQAVEAAWQAGIVVVVAAGNDGRDNSAGTDGYGTISAPGNDPYVITVGAMNTKNTPDRGDDVITSYSSKGPTAIDHIAKPDLVAPGNRVISLQMGGNLVHRYPQNRPSTAYYQTGGKAHASDKYFILSGTSMAAPVVSGAAALLLEQNPTLTPDQVKARLMKTAYKTFPTSSSVYDPATGQTYTDQYDVFTIGAGYVDLQAALSDSSLATLPSTSPTAYFDSTSGNVYFISDQHALWGSSSLWAPDAVWGTNVFDATQVSVSGSQALWGSHALWGSSGTSGFSALWGSHALWGSSSATASEATTLLIDGEN